MTLSILQITYLIASITFILGLKMMGNAATARKGNLIAAVGMILAILATIFLKETPVSPIIYVLIFSAILVGTIIGWITAKKVQMTKMPELVSMFNGMGGACAALIGLMEFHHNLNNPTAIATILAGMVIGSVSFSGSIIAFLKLNGTMNKPIRLPSYNILNTIVMIAVIGFGTWMVISGTHSQILLYSLFVAALIYGVLFVVPIGGADMPVVISLLNSFTGLAAAFGGFLYDNKVMLTGGILVGSAGTILTLAMCKAMNRPLFNVIFGAFGESSAAGSADDVKGHIKDISTTD